MGGTNQFGTNTCHHNKKLDQILNHLHLFGDFPKSPINEYSDICEIFHGKWRLAHNMQPLGLGNTGILNDYAQIHPWTLMHKK